MKRFPIQSIAIPIILVAIVVVILTKINQPKEITPNVEQTSSTMPRPRKESSSTATLSSRSSRNDSRRSEREITHKAGTHSEEYWKDYLARVQNHDVINDEEIRNDFIIIASNPKAPEWARVKAMASALVFTDDENYDHDIKPLAIRTDLPDALHDLILEDLLKRPHPTAMPVARHIANTNGHLLADVLDEYVKSHE